MTVPSRGPLPPLGPRTSSEQWPSPSGAAAAIGMSASTRAASPCRAGPAGSASAVFHVESRLVARVVAQGGIECAASAASVPPRPDDRGEQERPPSRLRPRKGARLAQETPPDGQAPNGHAMRSASARTNAPMNGVEAGATCGHQGGGQCHGERLDAIRMTAPYQLKRLRPRGPGQAAEAASQPLQILVPATGRPSQKRRRRRRRRAARCRTAAGRARGAPRRPERGAHPRPATSPPEPPRRRPGEHTEQLACRSRPLPMQRMPTPGRRAGDGHRRQPAHARSMPATRRRWFTRYCGKAPGQRVTRTRAARPRCRAGGRALRPARLEAMSSSSAIPLVGPCAAEARTRLSPKGEGGPLGREECARGDEELGVTVVCRRALRARGTSRPVPKRSSGTASRRRRRSRGPPRPGDAAQEPAASSSWSSSSSAAGCVGRRGRCVRPRVTPPRGTAPSASVRALLVAAPAPHSNSAARRPGHEHLFELFDQCGEATLDA